MSLRRFSRLIIFLLCTCPLVSEAQDALRYAGATTLQHYFMPEAALTFHRETDNVVKIDGGNTNPGLQRLLKRDVDMAGTGRHLTAAEKQQGLLEHFLGWDILAIIVNTSNPVESLTKEQVQGIFSGRINNWQEVGGIKQPIAVINAPKGSGMRNAVQQLILKQETLLSQEIISPNVGECDHLVAAFPSGITALSRSMLDHPKAKSIKIGGNEATPETIHNGTYPYAKPLALVTNGTPAGVLAQFISLATGETGQNILNKHFVAKE